MSAQNNRTKSIIIFLAGVLIGGVLCSIAGLAIWGTTSFLKPAIFAPTSRSLPQPTQVPTQYTVPLNTGNIGDEVKCGNYFIVKVLQPPELRKSVDYYNAAGKYLILRIELINNTSTSFDLGPLSYEAKNDIGYILKGALNSQSVQYRFDESASSLLSVDLNVQPNYGLASPSVSYKTALAFDINPQTTNLIFIFDPIIVNSSTGTWHDICKAEISLGQ